MHFNCRSFIGKENPCFWSQTWENEPDLTPSCHLFGLLNLRQVDSQSDLKTVGRELINQINQIFFSLESSDINQKISQTIDKISHDPTFTQLKIDLALLVICHNQSYIGIYGKTQVILQRGAQISQLISGFPDQFFQISGPIQNDDRFILATLDFVDQLSWEKIKTTIVEPKIQNIEESILSQLYSLENQNNLISFLIEIHSDPDIEISPPSVSNFPQNDITFPPTPETQPTISPQPIVSHSRQPEIYVKNKFKFKIGNHKKIQLIIALTLLVGLIFSFYLGYQKNQNQKAESSFQNLKSELETKLNNISVVKNLNIETAYQSAKEAQEIINKMISLNIHSDQINQYKSQVDLILSQSGDSESFKPESVYDASLIVSQPNFSKLVFSKSTLYLLDNKSGRIDSLTPQEKSTKNIIISDQVKSGIKLLVDNNNLYLLSSNQVSLVDKNQLTAKIDLSSNSITLTDAHFWNGFFYILDRNSQSIWKVTPNASGFSSPQTWLKNDAKLELGSVSLTIDSQIWTLTESGQIYLYNSGLKQKFSQSQEINFTKTSNLVTDADSDYLIFSDNSKFIYVYKKTGEFAFKFNLGELQVLDVAFDAPNKTIYFLASDQKIYKISL